MSRGTKDFAGPTSVDQKDPLGRKGRARTQEAMRRIASGANDDLLAGFDPASAAGGTLTGIGRGLGPVTADLAQGDTNRLKNRGPGGTKMGDPYPEGQNDDGASGFAHSLPDSEAVLADGGEYRPDQSGSFNGMFGGDADGEFDASQDPRTYKPVEGAVEGSDDVIDRLALELLTKNARSWAHAEQALASYGFPVGVMNEMFESGVFDVNGDDTLHVIAKMEQEDVMGIPTELPSYVGDPQDTAQRDPQPDRVAPYGGEEIKDEVGDRENDLAGGVKAKAQRIRREMSKVEPNITGRLESRGVHVGIDDQDSIRAAMLYAVGDQDIDNYLSNLRRVTANVSKGSLVYMVPIADSIKIADRLEDSGFTVEAIALDKINRQVMGEGGGGGGAGGGSTAVPYAPAQWEKLKERGLIKDVPDPAMRQTDYKSPAETQKEQ